MTNQSVGKIVGLSIITLGIYGFVWFPKTKGELNTQGADIPTAWLMIVPIVNIWWYYKYFEGAEKVTNGASNLWVNLLLSLVIHPVIAMAMCQSEYNKIAGGAAPAQPMQQPPVQPPTA